MRYALLIGLMALGCLSCGGVDERRESTPGSFAGLPSPAELDASASPGRQASATPGVTSRVLVNTGDQFSTAPGHANRTAANATLERAEMQATGSSWAELSYCIYRLAPAALDSGATLDAVMIDTFPVGNPAGDQGIYIGLGDRAADTWRFIPVQSAERTWYDLSALNLRGDDALSTWACVINWSPFPYFVNNIYFRYRHSSAIDGDEWIYFTYYGDGDAIARIRVGSGEPAEEIRPAPIPTAWYRHPVIGRVNNTWKVYYHTVFGHSERIERCNLDGSAPEIVLDWSEPLRVGAFNPAGDRFLFAAQSAGVWRLYAGATVGGTGSLGRTIDNAWDMSWYLSPLTGGYHALVAGNVGTSAVTLRTFQSETLPVSVTPASLFTPVVGETMATPSSVEVSDSFGSPVFRYLFASRGRMDPTRSSIFMVRPGTAAPEPEFRLVADRPGSDGWPGAEYIDLTDPVPSPDGRRVAYLWYPQGEDTITDGGRIYVTDLWDPDQQPHVVVTDRALSGLCWFDPTP